MLRISCDETGQARFARVSNWWLPGRGPASIERSVGAAKPRLGRAVKRN
jgi:hypothetical protein